MATRAEVEQSVRYRALQAAIRVGIESGVGDKRVPEIMEDVEARLLSNAAYRLALKTATDLREMDDHSKTRTCPTPRGMEA